MRRGAATAGSVVWMRAGTAMAGRAEADGGGVVGLGRRMEGCKTAGASECLRQGLASDSFTSTLASPAAVPKRPPATTCSHARQSRCSGPSMKSAPLWAAHGHAAAAGRDGGMARVPSAR
jgi:hypothetical protein